MITDRERHEETKLYKYAIEEYDANINIRRKYFRKQQNFVFKHLDKCSENSCLT